jgi:PST family polysaccharide transporter
MNDPNTHPDADLAASGERGMGRTAGSGAIWMAFATIVGKSASFIAQILLGIYLLKVDFALFAYATAATKLLSICQDAGIKDLLIQEGAAKYKSLSGPIFWFAAAFNGGVSLLIAVVTPLVAMYYDDPRLQPMMWVLLLAIPLGTPAAVLSTKLRLDLRFRETSLVSAAVAVLRQFGQVALAMAGAGAMSFVYPAVAVALIESVLLWWVTRDSPWKRPAEARTWGTLVARTKYLIMGSVANLLLDQGPSLVLQPSLRFLGGMAKGQADTIQGTVFWAFQMTAQVGVLLSYNLQLVLAPIFQRLSGDRERLQRSVVRALSVMMMTGSIACIGFGLVMDPLEKMIFQGKWHDASLAVAIYGLFFPFRILYGLTVAAQLGTGQSAAYFWCTLIQGAVFTLGAVAAGEWATTATGVAWWTGASLAIIMILVTLWILKGLGIAYREAAVEMCWPWFLAVLAGGVGWSVDAWVPLDALVTHEWNNDVLVGVHINTVGSYLDQLPIQLASMGLGVSSQARCVEAIRFVLLGSTCAISFTVFARFFMPDVLREFLRVAPAKIGHPLQRLLMIRNETGSV